MSNDKDSVDGGEVIASGCKPEGEGFDSPSTLPRRIEYNEVKSGLWISKHDIFVIQAKLKMIPQKEIDDVLETIDKLRYRRPSMWKLLVFFILGSLAMTVVNILIGVW